MRGRLLNAYAICPAYAYFKFHFPEQATPSMEMGKELDVREVVEKYVNTKCKKLYSVKLKGEYGSGIADAIVLCDDSLEVVEVKLSDGFKRPQIVQAAFYCLLAEETFDKVCTYLWLCSPTGCVKKKFTPSLRQSVIGMVESLVEDLKSLPKAKRNSYCSYCKYSSICPWAKD